MIFFLLDYLSSTWHWKIPFVFHYYSTRMILAAITSLVISIFLGPKFIEKLYALKIGQSIRKEYCEELWKLHGKKKDTPTMGGLLILTSMLISMFLWMDLTHVFTLILFLTTACLGFIGALDDYLKIKHKSTKGLSGKKKMLGQVLFSCLLALYFLYPPLSEAIHIGNWYSPPVIKLPQAQDQIVSIREYASFLYFPFFKDPVWQFSGWSMGLFALLIILVITGTSNAVNLTDGLDGLAAGCLLFVASSLAVVAFISNHIDFSRYLHVLYIEGSGEVAIYLAAFIGACLGFLWYNGYPAQIFMGDTGSIALGGIIGVSAILLRREFLLAIIGGVFVAEALSVILQVASCRLRGGKRIFLCSPLHHHFEYKGWPETKVVIRFWIVGLLLALLGIASLKFQ